jgi:hypothetical protein
LDWSHDALWLKTKLYASRAAAENRSSALFGLWSALTLELLARSALAFVHPSLLADPRGDDVLYAAGVTVTWTPRSIPTRTVLQRCVLVVPDFTDTDRGSCMNFVERRNAELHSGGLAFESFPAEVWLAEYYRLCDLLLKAQGKSLGRLFGGDEAVAARKMIRASAATIKKRVMDSVSAHRRDFESLTDDERAERRVAVPLILHPPPNARPTDCPACGSREFVEGKTVRSSPPQLEGDEVVIDTVALPVRFECRVCGLKLNSHAALHAVGLGGQYTHRETWEIDEYYGRSESPWEYYDDDEYGND